jgi:hypothetical protein
MLLIKSIDQVHQLVRLAEPREKIIFFQFLVIILNERPNQLSGRHHHIRGEVPLGIDPIHDLPINQDNTLQNAVFAHQIFRGRDSFVRIALLGSPATLPLRQERT